MPNANFKTKSKLNEEHHGKKRQKPKKSKTLDSINELIVVVDAVLQHTAHGY